MNNEKLEEMLKPMGNTFIETFERLANTQQDKNFIYYGEEDKSYTYGEFNSLVNCVAHNLKASGIEKGDRVSLLVFNPIVTTLSMFAIWKLGAVYCPINYNYADSQLAYQINDTKPKLLITEQAYVDKINQVNTDISALPIVLHCPLENDHSFCATSAQQQLAAKFSVQFFSDFLSGDSSNLGTVLHGSDVANIIYTSGTTGNPKGVVQPQRYLHNYLFASTLTLHPDDVVYNDLPLYHAGGAFFNVVKAAWAGCSIALWDKFSPSNFWQRITKCQATHAVLLDVMIPWLLSQDSSETDQNNSLKSVQMMPLPENHNEIAKRYGFDFVSVGYGSSETGAVIGAVIDELGDTEGVPEVLRKGYSKQQVLDIIKENGMDIIDGQQDIKARVMGEVLPLHQIKIIDERGDVVEKGVPGQLLIKPNLPDLIIKEYLNKSEETQKSIKDDWYHSGDIIVEDTGLFYFVDRAGGFIRSRGENMSSFQVEALINKHPAVSNSAVFSIDAEQGLEEDIAAFIVLEDPLKLTEDDFIGWMKENMPKYMQAKHIRFVDALPVTPTFKVEKYKMKQQIMQELFPAKD